MKPIISFICPNCHTHIDREIAEPEPCPVRKQAAYEISQIARLAKVSKHVKKRLLEIVGMLEEK